PAPVADVWAAWTTSEGMSQWLAPAKIELRIHGPFEVYFDPSQAYGLKGAEGCHVLSYVPQRMLAFEWNAPPSVPQLRDANMRNWVVVMFDPVSEGETKLTLTHLGWGEGEAWDANFTYFDKAWKYVLEACKMYFGGDESG
ncbi:hypothetical protein GF377_09010, partial [candidate division GN15 bacterium]|nr:hypothetical protein [candidate division GN15 bacterium]